MDNLGKKVHYLLPFENDFIGHLRGVRHDHAPPFFSSMIFLLFEWPPVIVDLRAPAPGNGLFHLTAVVSQNGFQLSILAMSDRLFALRLFARVARKGSFSAAGRELNVPQSTAS